MDENDSTRGHQFNGNEAISAVVDEAFLGEEEDDYEDLYNDVNVGENFHHSLRKNGDGGSKIEQVKEEHGMPSNKADAAKSEVVEDVNVSSRQEEVVDRVEGYQNVNDADIGRGMSAPSSVGGGGGFRVELNKVGDLGDRNVGNTGPSNQQVVQNQQYQQNQQPAVAADIGNVYGASGGGGGGGGGTVLYVGDLHWWTTDADLESELCKYGPLKELKFFEERASGKSKGYCQVEFYDPAAATACKEVMNGRVFNERPCVVAFASPYNIRKMGEAQANRNQQQMGQGSINQLRRGPGDFPIRPGGVVDGMPTGGINQGGMESNGRGFGRGNWGRGGAVGGMGIRGQSGPMRNRGGGAMGPRGMAGTGNGFGHPMGGVPPLLPPQSMMGQGFDPAFGGPMGRMGGYGGFPGAPAAPFPGLFGPMGNVGLPGVAPHVNPAFFGRGMPMGGMGMMPNAGPGVDGSNVGMWSDPNVGGWVGDDHGARAGESSYGEEAASEHQYEEGSQERGGPVPNATKEKDRGSERDRSGSPDRRYHDDRGQGYDRDKPREKDMERDHEYVERRQRDDRDARRDRDKERSRDRERSLDHDRDRERDRDVRDRRADQRKYRNRDAEYDDERDRGRSSRTYSKSRHEERRSRSRDADYGKRRRMTSD